MSDCDIPRESLGFLMQDVTRLLRKRFEGQAAALGLTSAQWRLLVNLMRHGPLPQARLAELLEIEPISLSRLVDRMAEAGWVERRPDPNDRRIRIVHATDQTRAQIGAARHIADSIYAEALAGLPPDASETMTAMLRRIICNLSQPTETDHDR